MKIKKSKKSQQPGQPRWVLMHELRKGPEGYIPMEFLHSILKGAGYLNENGYPSRLANTMGLAQRHLWNYEATRKAIAEELAKRPRATKHVDGYRKHSQRSTSK
jgi:hypothetical protein